MTVNIDIYRAGVRGAERHVPAGVARSATEIEDCIWEAVDSLDDRIVVTSMVNGKAAHIRHDEDGWRHGKSVGDLIEIAAKVWCMLVPYESTTVTHERSTDPTECRTYTPEFDAHGNECGWFSS